MSERNSRQSFLGDKFLAEMPNIPVAIAGLGGGGSIIVNSLPHIGFENYFVCDPDDLEEPNITRQLGSKYEDIRNKTPKIDIAERVIRGVQPRAKVCAHKKTWQECIEIEEFQSSRIIFSCLDDFSNRMQIEAFARRHRIPLIDIGLTIKKAKTGSFYMMGQTVLSHPKGPCFKCYNFITDEDLAKEASNYGDAGVRPQVIWANSILANIGVGLAVEILSQWTEQSITAFYKHLDGNKMEVFDNLKIKSGIFNESFKCPHYD